MILRETELGGRVSKEIVTHDGFTRRRETAEGLGKGIVCRKKEWLGKKALSKCVRERMAVFVQSPSWMGSLR